jgi:hypothetical protein
MTNEKWEMRNEKGRWEMGEGKKKKEKTSRLE